MGKDLTVQIKCSYILPVLQREIVRSSSIVWLPSQIIRAICNPKYSKGSQNPKNLFDKRQIIVSGAMLSAKLFFAPLSKRISTMSPRRPRMVPVPNVGCEMREPSPKAS